MPDISGADALARLAAQRRRRALAAGAHRPDRRTADHDLRGGDFARLVLFGAADGAKLAWHVTYRATSTAFYDAVVDATSGAILFRQNLTKAAANAQVYPNHPGAGAPVTVDLEDFGLPAGSTVLDGEFSRQWADLDDDDGIDTGEETTLSAGTDFLSVRAAARHRGLHGNRALRMGHDRSDTSAATRTTNRLQNGVQAFYLVSRFHDHLETAPIGFTSEWGNFGGRRRRGGRPRPTTASVPDGAGCRPPQQRQHVRPAGRAVAAVQMYLFRPPPRRAASTTAASTAATTPASSGTSTRTVSPAAW